MTKQNKSQINNSHSMAESINNLLTSSRESKDSKTSSKTTSTPTLTINQRQFNTYNNNLEVDKNNKNESFSLKETSMFNKIKEPINTLNLGTISENDESHNSTSSSIDGDLHICEDPNSSASSNGDNFLENITHSSPIYQPMGERTRSKSNVNSIDNNNIQIKNK